MSTSRRAIALAALAALLALTVGCTQRVVSVEPNSAANTVTASGMGDIAATPDEATMSFGVTRRAADAKKALDAAATAAEKINGSLKSLGIDDKDIQTTGVNVYPQYAEVGGKSTISGFEASVNVTAKIKDLDRLGAIISALSDAGADTVSGPAFGIGDESTYRADAIKEAVEDARSQAEEMADAAGKSVGDVVSITSSAVNVPQPFLYGAAGAEKMADAAAVPIEPGQLDVTANVTVVFELR